MADERLGQVQRYLGLALGDEAGARLAQRISVPLSADTLLRMAASTTPYKLPVRAPRVLAVDDWAWRRGHRYGSILVDLESNQVVDLLPDRHAKTLAGWLREHPGVAVIARDRAGAYADGIRQGAPNAVQVADRWHLLRNLGDAVRAVVERHQAGIRKLSRQIIEETAATLPTEPPPVIRPTASERRSQVAYARRQARYEEAARLKAIGIPLRRMAVMIGAERKTIRRWLRAGDAPRWRKPPRTSLLDAFRAHLERRWSEGCRNAVQLWRELLAIGFAGRPSIVRQWAGRRRKGEPRCGPTARDEKPQTTRQLARLLMSDGDFLSETEQIFKARVLAQMLGLASCVEAAKRLNKILRRTSSEALSDVLNHAANTPLKEFVINLQHDIGAVQAALDLPWTTSPAEGQINRLKMLKRTMYGRAGFNLLRARVMYPI